MPPDQFEVNVICTLPISDTKLHQLKTGTHADPSLQQLMKLVEEGWPSKKNKVPSQCLPFWNFRDHCDGILFRNAEDNT